MLRYKLASTRANNMIFGTYLFTIVTDPYFHLHRLDNMVIDKNSNK